MVCGNKLKRSILSNSAGIYNFQRALQLDQEEVSQDHTFGGLAGTKAKLTQAAGLSLSLQGAQSDKGPKGGNRTGDLGFLPVPIGKRRDAQGSLLSSMGRTQSMG